MSLKYDILLKNGYLIDGTGSKGKDNVTVGIKDGNITYIGRDNITSDKLYGDKIIELDGATILPGFINAHVHAGFKYVGNRVLRDFQKEYLQKCIKEGVTTVRDEGMFTDDTIDTVVEKRNLYKDYIEFPRIIITGKFFSAPGGYGGQAPIAIETIEDAKTHVHNVIFKGIDMIKTVLEEGLDPSTYGLPKLSDELLSAICMEAHKRNTKVSAHVTQSHNLKRLIAAGIDDAGHMVYDHLSDELITDLVQKNIYVVSTLTVLKMFEDKFGAPLLETGKNNVRRFVEAGGKIAFGDDFIEVEEPWYRLGMPYMELQLLKDAGLSELQIITAATKHGAEVCNVAHETGTLELGKKADILIVRGNPETDINNIKNVLMVLKEGKEAVNKI